MRDFPTIEARGRVAKEVPLVAQDGGAPKRNHFYALEAKRGNSGDDTGKI